jgi:hypothetical protein
MLLADIAGYLRWMIAGQMFTHTRTGIFFAAQGANSLGGLVSHATNSFVV